MTLRGWTNFIGTNVRINNTKIAVFHEPDKKFVIKFKKKFNIKNLNYYDLIKNVKKIKKLVNISFTNINSDSIANVLIDAAKY